MSESIDRPDIASPRPPRYRLPPLRETFGLGLLLVVLAWSFLGAGWSFADLGRGLPAIADFLARTWPPRLDRIDNLGAAFVETFQMALVGTFVGAILSLPIAILAARGLVGGRFTYAAARGLVALFRTVPDLVWALIFVIAVGLGPFAGTLAIVVDTIGFCGRFFAEAMEDVDKAPAETLLAQGARKLDTVFCTILPAAAPAFITTSLFALEKSTRSSVILGLVGAGGIGLELKVSMDMFDYQQAATIIIMIFALVLGVERIGSWARSRALSS
ncbi:MAG: phosphonate ABC transporter, permease protein PhnE [Devosia sp.]